MEFHTIFIRDELIANGSRVRFLFPSYNNISSLRLSRWIREIKDFSVIEVKSNNSKIFSGLLDNNSVQIFEVQRKTHLKNLSDTLK